MVKHTVQMCRYKTSPLTSTRNVNVEVKAVLALVDKERQQLLQVQQSAPWQLQQSLGAVPDVGGSLGAHRREGVRETRVAPHGGRYRGHITQRSDWRGSVGYTKERLNRWMVVLNDHTSQRTVLGLYNARTVLVNEK